MIEKTVSWREFLNEAKFIQEKSKESQKTISLPLEIRENEDCSIPFFRGVSKSNYELETSLDRVKRNMFIGEYYKIIDQLFKKLSIEQQKNYFLSTKKESKIPDIYKNYLKYNSFLRHFGFPSSWLDWTSDPYVALFFAFSDIYSTEDKAIYVFRADQKMQPKYDYLFSDYDVNLFKSPQDPLNIRAENQRSYFTACISKNKEQLCFGYHHEILSKSNELLIKYIILNKGKKEILSELFSKNINYCYLYGETDENKLMDYALQEF